MASWKKTGGINYSSKFHTVRVQNAVSGTSSFVGDLGEPNTVTDVNSTLHIKDSSAIYSSTSAIDDRGLVAFYRFTDIVVPGTAPHVPTIPNQATFAFGLVGSAETFDHSTINLEFVDVVGADAVANVMPIEVGPVGKAATAESVVVPDSLITEKAAYLHFDSFVRFGGRTRTGFDTIGNSIFSIAPCKALISKTTVNFSSYSTSTTAATVDQPLRHHHSALTVMCWMRINKFDAGDPGEADSNGFMLFSLDDGVDGPATDTVESSLHFWAPGHKTNGAPQVHFGGRSKVSAGPGFFSAYASEATTDTNAVTGTSLPNNTWTMVALVINGNRACIYQETDGTHACTKEIDIGDFRVPEKRIVVNGTRFFDVGADAFTAPVVPSASDMNVDIADLKVFNYAVDPHTIFRTWAHDNPFFTETTNFRIDPAFATFGNDLVVGGDARVNRGLTVTNTLRTTGALEAYSDAFVAGSLGVGVPVPLTDPAYRLSVVGGLRASGHLSIGDVDAATNGISIRGSTTSSGTHIVERALQTHNELLLFKGGIEGTGTGTGTDGTGSLADGIRLRAPNVYVDTFAGTDTDGISTTAVDSSRFVFDQRGRLGVMTTDPAATLDVRGTVHLTDGTGGNVLVVNDGPGSGSGSGSGSGPENNVGVGAGVFGGSNRDPELDVFVGDANAGIGAGALSALTHGDQNVAVGKDALGSLTVGSQNVAVGHGALNGTTTTTGNVALGANSGQNGARIGNNNLFVGPGADVAPPDAGSSASSPVSSVSSVSGSAAIGPGATVALSDATNIGNAANTMKVGINNPAPTCEMDVNGDLNVSGTLTINGTVFSIDSGGDGGTGQLSFESGIASGGPSIFKDVTIMGSTLPPSDPSATPPTYDFEVQNRNIRFQNYPPGYIGEFGIIEKASKTYQTAFATDYTKIPDNPITFDGHVQFSDSYNTQRVDRADGNSGFVVKSMDAAFDNNVTIGDSLTVKKAPYTETDTGGGGGSTVIAPDSSFVVDPSTNTALINATTTFPNKTTFGPSTTDSAGAVTTNGSVFFNNPRVEFSSTTDVFVYGTLFQTSGTASAMSGGLNLNGLLTVTDASFGDVGYVGNGIDASCNALVRGNLGVDGDAAVAGDLTVAGTFNFNNIVQNNITETDHTVVRMSERLVVENSDTVGEVNGVTTVDAPALHVTQHGAHPIAEFYDGDLVGSESGSGSGCVFRIGSAGATELYGALGIGPASGGGSAAPGSGLSLDVSGATRLSGNVDLVGSMYLGSVALAPAGGAPRCALDIGSTDSVQLPVGNDLARTGIPTDGMIRYNSETVNSGYLEYYGTGTTGTGGTAGTAGTADTGGWQRVAGGGVVSHPKNVYVEVAGTERLGVDTDGNVRLGSGRGSSSASSSSPSSSARLHIDAAVASGEVGTFDIDMVRLERARSVGAGAATDVQATDIVGRWSVDGQFADINAFSATGTKSGALTIAPDGRVGAGTGAPLSRLHAYDATDNCTLTIGSGAVGKKSSIDLVGINSASSAATCRMEYDASGDRLDIFHGSGISGGSGTGSTKLSLTAAGRLGIGTVVPESSLHIHKGDSVGGGEVVRLTARADALTDAVHTAAFNLVPGGTGTDRSMLELMLHDNAVPVIRARSDGLVGINMVDANMDDGAALQVADGDIVLGQANTVTADRTRSLKILGTGVETTIGHDSTGTLRIGMAVDGTGASGPAVSLSKTGPANNIAFAVADGKLDVDGRLFVSTTPGGATIDSGGNTLTLAKDSAAVPGHAITMDAAGTTVGLSGAADTFYVGTKITMDESSGNVTTTTGDVVATAGSGTFGNATVGSGTGTGIGSAIGSATFSHISASDSASISPAISQSAVGSTIVGAATGQTISFNIGDTAGASLGADGVFNISDTAISAGTAILSEFAVGDPINHDGTTTHTFGATPVSYNLGSTLVGADAAGAYIWNTPLNVVGGQDGSLRGMLVDTESTDSSVVTINGDLTVNGSIISNALDAALSIESAVTALKSASAQDSEQTRQVFIGGNNDATGRTAVDNCYLTINGTTSLNSIHAYGAVVTESYFAAASDIKLKENVVTIDGALDKTRKLRGVYFNKKAAPDGPREVGVIAQEIEEVVPEVVSMVGDTKTVAYANLCGLLIEAVKELGHENGLLRDQVTELKTDISGIWENKRASDRATQDALSSLRQEIATVKRSTRM